MKKFKRSEILIIGVILAVLGVLTYLNLTVSLRRARDFQRKEDVKNIADALMKYHEDLGFYPPSDNFGKIVACGDPAVGCNWGWDSLVDPDDSARVYLESLPADPKNQAGYSYTYIANRDHFQIFSALEGTDEAEFRKDILDRGIICGAYRCNFGRSDGSPLDKSLEEYENEINEK